MARTKFHALLIRLWGAALLCLCVSANALDVSRPVISIIIDDIGYSRSLGEQALALPHGVTLAILPFAPYSKHFSEKAQNQGREFMLHIPMKGHENENLDPGILTSDMSEAEFIAAIESNLDALDGYAGINNHKGSELTADEEKMRLFLQQVAKRERLFVIDSKTTRQSYLSRFASTFGVPYASRNVFLDVDRSPDAIKEQFSLLLAKAKQKGYAIAIGHPHPETLATLSELLQDDLREEFLLLPVQQQLELRQHGNRLATAGFD
ncbi:MAG: divergent polysaccharide deacetylase family protein [Pseudomonadota bacterium]